MIPLADLGPTVNHRVGTHLASLSDYDVGANDDKGADLYILGNLRPRIYYG
jgi:hypothetical protein